MSAIQKVLQGINSSDEEAYQAYVEETYGADRLKKITRFFISAQLQGLESMLTDEMHELLFTHEAGPFFQIDEPSVQRSHAHYEQQLVGSYVFADPRESLHTPLHTSLDIVYARKEIPEHLRTILKKQKIHADTLIDFEIFEYPHYNHDYYYGLKHKEFVQEVLRNTEHSNKDIAYAFRAKETPLYRDTEKIHLQFIAAQTKKGVTYIPIYIGIGTNEPYMLSERGAFGKQRFLKYNFIDKETGIEHWSPTTTPCSKETLAALQKYDFRETHEDMQRKVFSMLDTTERDPKFPFGDFDEDRFKGFLEYQKDTKRQTLLQPGFQATPIDVGTYLDALQNGQPTIHGHPIPRKLSDITTLLSSVLQEYEYYSATALDPLFLVKKHGIDTCSKATAHKLDSGGSNFVSGINVASDIYALGVDSWHRLKCAALLFAHLEKYGQLQEILA